jgi:hypothetical protein|tara:strand:- start:1371 stop:1547 length:177 start_codon:yes stop_codon:yes gene_type:complete
MAIFEVMLTHTVVEVFEVEASNETEASRKAMNGKGVLEQDWHLAYDKETIVRKEKETT